MRIYLIYLILISLFACSGDRKPDISKINYKLSIHRTEIDIFEKRIAFKQDELYSFYLNQVIVVADSGEYALFKADEKMNSIANDVKNKFTDFNSIELEIEKSIKYYLHYFPKAEIPQFFTMISGFAYPLVFDDSKIGIGLDYFLGEEYAPYSNFLPTYLIRKTNTENLVPMVIKALLQQQYDTPDNNSTFLDQLIYEGKILAMMDLLLPNTEDRLKITYSKDQLDWVQKNERDIWALFLQEDLLFTTDVLRFEKYFAEGPFTSGLDSKSAPRLGAFIGWQIVKKYAKESGKKPMEWMLENNAQEILKIANYRP